MPYPNIEGKHNFEPVYTPEDYLRYISSLNERYGMPAPEGMILVYDQSLFQHILASTGVRKDSTGDEFNLRNELGIKYVNGIGPSDAAVKMEGLIARGSRRFINIGFAGGLQKELEIGDIVVCDRAIRDDGVSHHYLADEKYVYLSSALTNTLKKKLTSEGIRFTEGTTWTTAAPYRETIRELKEYQKEGALTVEMEAAALAAVAEYRGMEFSAAFVVSDSLADFGWKPQFHSEKAAKGLRTLYHAVLSVL